MTDPSPASTPVPRPTGGIWVDQSIRRTDGDRWVCGDCGSEWPHTAIGPPFAADRCRECRPGKPPASTPDEPPAHHRIGWYEECFDRHPEPPIPEDATDAEKAAYEGWAETHFSVGESPLGVGESFWTCEEAKVDDACEECTAALQERKEDDQVYVPWEKCEAIR